MKYEDKVKLLEIFNTPGKPWTQEYYSQFKTSYRAWAAAMTKPLQDILENSELRKSLTAVIKLAPGEFAKAKPGALYLPNMGSWDVEEVGPDGFIKTFTVQAASNVRLGKVTVEATEKVVQKIAKAIQLYETEAVNKAKDAADKDNATLYIKQDFICYDDPSLIKKQWIGVFGWEEFGVVAHD